MTTWIARVEWATLDAYTEPAIDDLMTHLAGHSAAVGPEPVPAADLTPDPELGAAVGGTTVLASPAYWSATIAVEANTLRQAIASALELVEGATGEKAAGVEVLGEHVYDARGEHPAIPDLVGYAEIADMLGVTRQRALQLAGGAGFPVAVVETKAGPLRVKAQVEGWASRWERKSGRPRKEPAGA